MIHREISNGLIIGFLILLGFLYYSKKEGFAEKTYGPAPVTPGIPCNPGFWCPTASGGTKAFPCPGGSYGSEPKLKVPQCSGICKAGCVCKEASTEECPADCPEGYYCVAGTGGHVSPIICPQGYYCPAKTEVPQICPPGVFCPLGTSSVPK